MPALLTDLSVFSLSHVGHWNGHRDCEPAQLTEYQATVRARMEDMTKGERLLRVPSAETPPRLPRGGVLILTRIA
jgi:hypothetical protein